MTLRWYLSGTALAAAVGGLAAVCHLAGWAPVGILPLAVGVALGWGVTILADRFEVGCPKRLVAGATIFALVAIFSEHAWIYHDFRRQWHEARVDPQVALFRPEEPWSPAEYLRHEATGGRIALWGLDAALIGAGTLGLVLARRKLSGNPCNAVVADDAN